MTGNDEGMTLDLTDYSEPDAAARAAALLQDRAEAAEDEHAKLDAAWNLVIEHARSTDDREPEDDPRTMNADQREAWASDPALPRSEIRRRLGVLDELARESMPASATPPSMFIDLLTLDSADVVQATVARRSDGVHLIYGGAVNVLLGDPEQGKSLLGAAVAVEVARGGGVVLWLDLDHNGAKAFKSRLVALGARDDELRLMRFAQPEDGPAVETYVRWAIESGDPVALFVVDSIGELLPMFGASSDSADDYTRVNRQVLAAVARTGAAVLAVDHLAKNAESRAFGGTGTIAKKRTVDGALYRVEAVKPFAPGKGGEARMRLLKDRHGWVRAHSPEGREPVVARFVFEPDGPTTPGRWSIQPPGAAGLTPLDLDVAQVDTMKPAPTSYRDVKTAFGWRDGRAQAAMREWKSRRKP